MRPLRHFPSFRLWLKLALLDFAMSGAAIHADDENVPARERMEYGRRVMTLIRWHRRLSALHKPA